MGAAGFEPFCTSGCDNRGAAFDPFQLVFSSHLHVMSSSNTNSSEGADDAMRNILQVVIDYA
jgi:hypothetical protein